MQRAWEEQIGRGIEALWIGKGKMACKFMQQHLGLWSSRSSCLNDARRLSLVLKGAGKRSLEAECRRSLLQVSANALTSA
ncbi:MAG: hypothetical protein M1118_11715 [Chloroflexi bacterium]|nr:hypothetical protein [Chloroflexota bacterium]